MNEDLAALQKFDGTVRLFPLPSLVLFPHGVQPLHIFEQRYRQMTADALVGDRLIALVLLQPNWEHDYDARPAIYPVACVGRIIADQRLVDGRYNLLLRGLMRVRIIEEISSDKLYRIARVEMIEETDVPNPEHAARLRHQLYERVVPRFSSTDAARSQLEALFAIHVPLSTVCDTLSFALPLTLDFKQALLGESSLTKRVTSLIQGLEPPSTRRFPPDFSSN